MVSPSSIWKYPLLLKEKKTFSGTGIDLSQDFYTLYFEFDRKRKDGTNSFYGLFKAKVNLLPLKNSIVYQGEFNWHFNGDVREGVIYWQNIAN